MACRTSGPTTRPGSRRIEPPRRNTVMNRIVRLLTILAGLWIACGTAAHAADRCAPEGKVHYLCGPTNVEDMVHVQGTRWIIASGMTGPGQPQGRFYLIDAHAKSW